MDDEEWMEDGVISLRGDLEQMAAGEEGECFECEMVMQGGRFVHASDCPYAFDDEEEDDDDFFDDDEDGDDFEDVEDIDLLLAPDEEAEARIMEEENIPKEDLIDEDDLPELEEDEDDSEYSEDDDDADESSEAEADHDG